MIPALLVFGYAVAIACWLPALLTPLTRSGAGARLGLAGWLAAMGSVLVAGGFAIGFLIRSAVDGWSGLAEAVCRSVAGGACTPVIYRSALYELGLGAAALFATLTAVLLTWRCGRRVQQGRRRTRAHAEAARITGRQLPPFAAGTAAAGTAAAGTAVAGTAVAGTAVAGTAAAGTAAAGIVVLDASRPAAYCVPGRPRPGTIVVTSGALAVLGPAQLTAVLEHERAHLAGRHHLLVAVTRGLAAIFPCVPVFSQGSAEVARLTEMRADDAAARRAGRRPLIGALLALGTRAPVPPVGIPAAGLAAAGYAVAARVHRLLEPPSQASRARCGFALAGLLLALPTVSGLIFALASSA